MQAEQKSTNILQSPHIRKLTIQLAVLFCLLLIFSWITVLVYSGTFRQNFVFTSVGINNTDPIGEITDSLIIEQSISLNTDTEAIGLLMATYARINDGEIKIHVIDRDTGAILYDKKIRSNSIADNSSLGIAFENNQYAKNLIITISGVNTKPGSSPTIWMSSEASDFGDLSINGETVNGSLVYQIAEIKQIGTWKLFLNRIMLILFFFAFLILHIFIDYKKIYDFIFRHRVALTILLILFFVINKYHFSSITQFDGFVQPGTGSEYIEPIFGRSQAIRSDEWLVSTPSKLSAQYSDYGKFNEILRAEKTYNLSASGLYKGYSGLAFPLQWGFYFLGAERGFSLMSSAMFFLMLLISFEMCYILTKKAKRVVALLGACLIVFSSYNMWWSFVGWILTAQAAIVMLYYFLNTDKKLYRVLFGIGTAIFASSFILALYPAWQVPVGYLFLIILTWTVYSSRDNIKKFNKFDIGVFALCIVFMGSIIVTYLLDLREYMAAIVETVYPGRRYSYGGFALDKIANYIPSLIFPYRDAGNPSELSIFVSFFPLPILINFFYMIRSKKINLLATSMIVLSLIFTAFSLFEWPHILARITLLNYSMPHRIVDIIAFIQVYLLVIALSHYDENKRIGIVTSFLTSTVIIASTVYVAYRKFPTYIMKWEILLIGIGLILLVTVILSVKKQPIRDLAIATMITILMASSMTVNPLVKSFDVLYTKPISYQIKAIVQSNSDAKWIATDNLVDSGFLVANGAPTINSVNSIPNYNLWNKIDPSGEFEYVYNRYAHLVISLIDEPTSIELMQADAIILGLNHNDLVKTGARFLVSSTELSSTDAYRLSCLYQEYGKYIYEIDYIS